VEPFPSRFAPLVVEACRFVSELIGGAEVVAVAVVAEVVGSCSEGDPPASASISRRSA
jgi:hypothetical protein